MDKLVETEREKYWCRDAWARDQWVKAHAEKLPSGSKVLDAGVGASKYRPFFSHCDYKTQDFCQYQGPLVKYLQPVDYVCDIRAIPLPDSSLDAIVCTEVFEHLPDPMAALKEFSRLLRDGGKVLITAPQLSGLHMEPYHFYSGFTVFWYKHWLAEYQFDILEVTPQGGQSRAVASSLEGIYNNWRDYEKKLSGFARLWSLTLRMFWKFPTHHILPWAYSKLDDKLDPLKMCTGLMVAGARKPRE